MPVGKPKMNIDEFVRRRILATEEFNSHESRSDGVQVASSLSAGLTILRDALYARVHDDVERVLGMDSALAPLSYEKTERIAKAEIDIFQVAASAVAARDCGYVSTPDHWYPQWLVRFRLGELCSQPKVVSRLEHYLSRTSDSRRLMFTNVLAHAVPESRQAPLVLFRLHPLAVEIATALAFRGRVGATQIRKQQVAELPEIRDCQACRGALLDNGEQCRACGNPLWKFEWLLAAD
jgi:hypothetical protein